MKKALVCGAGGFIAHHLVKKLKSENYWVRGVDLKQPEFSSSLADDFLLLDLREKENCIRALNLDSNQSFDEVYQLAADMGGMGFIEEAEAEILVNSALINLHMLTSSYEKKIPKYFFSSSACVYPDMDFDDKTIDESGAYPAMPDNEYGWEKLYAERVALTFQRRYGMYIRIARFQNCYGPEGTWQGGREKAPAALSRKIAKLEDQRSIDVWGDGTAMRSYIYVDDLVDGIFHLMHSEITEPTNIGSEEFVSVNQLVSIIAKISGKDVKIQHTDGPVGVKARNHSFQKIKDSGFSAKTTLEQGMIATYRWIEEQVKQST